jgi:hypothetical protein
MIDQLKFNYFIENFLFKFFIYFKRFCIYMIEKYAEDHVKMAKDYKNLYQYTPKQIKRQINQFKNMKKAYDKYLLDKKSGVDFLSKLDEKF